MQAGSPTSVRVSARCRCRFRHHARQAAVCAPRQAAAPRPPSRPTAAPLSLRPVHQGRQDPLPRFGQCRQDDAAAYAEAREDGQVRARRSAPAARARREVLAREFSRSLLTISPPPPPLSLPSPPPRSHVPTAHPGESELTINNVHFKAFDLGGHEAGASPSHLLRAAAPRMPRPCRVARSADDAFRLPSRKHILSLSLSFSLSLSLSLSLHLRLISPPSLLPCVSPASQHASSGRRTSRPSTPLSTSSTRRTASAFQRRRRSSM